MGLLRVVFSNDENRYCNFFTDFIAKKGLFNFFWLVFELSLKPHSAQGGGWYQSKYHETGVNIVSLPNENSAIPWFSH